jgi:hypothetical protein
MPTLKLKIKSGKGTDLTGASVVLGNHAIDNDQDHHLTLECVTVRELESEIAGLKGELDDILAAARRKMTRSPLQTEP